MAGFWRKEVIGSALRSETGGAIGEQIAWIEREPANPRPYYQLAQLYRVEQKPEEALALLLEAVRLEGSFAPAHAALAELYAVRQDYAAAWRHARAAEHAGDARAVALLTRHAVPEPE